MTVVKLTTALDASSAAATSSAIELDGATDLTLFVIVSDTLDTAGGDTFTATLQGSVEGTYWAPLLDENGNAMEITETDVAQQDGAEYTDYVSTFGLPMNEVRVVLSNFNDASDTGTTPTDDLEVTSKVLGAEG